MDSSHPTLTPLGSDRGVDFLTNKAIQTRSKKNDSSYHTMIKKINGFSQICKSVVCVSSSRASNQGRPTDVPLPGSEVTVTGQQDGSPHDGGPLPSLITGAKPSECTDASVSVLTVEND